MATEKKANVCEFGHKFYKSSDCRVCPVCEKKRKPTGDFLSLLPAPARRALENNGITTVEKLSEFSEKEILGFHGTGKSTILKLQKILSTTSRTFKSKE